MYKTPLPFIGGGLISAAFNKSKKEKETEEKESFKGVREGNLRRKANKILSDAEAEGRLLTEQEQDRLKDLKSKAMSAEARQEKRNERYAEQKARTDLKRNAYANKMAKKGIMTEEQAKSRFDQIRGITARSAANVPKVLGEFSVGKKAADVKAGIDQDKLDTAAYQGPPPDIVDFRQNFESNVGRKIPGIGLA